MKRMMSPGGKVGAHPGALSAPVAPPAELCKKPVVNPEFSIGGREKSFAGWLNCALIAALLHDYGLNPQRGESAADLATHRSGAENVPNRTANQDLATDLLAIPLTAHVQAITDLRSRHVWGFEALVRGVLDGRLLHPEHMLEIARQQDRLLDFDLRCFAATTRVARTLPPGVLTFVNIYAQTLLDPLGLDAAIDLLRPLAAEGRQMVVEVHESMTSGQLKVLTPAFIRLKELGIRIALDDLLPKDLTFGHLRVRPDFIKVDRGIFQDMTQVEIARTINTLARCQESLGYTLIVEGIEDEEMLSIAAFAGASKGQGYLFGRPVPHETPVVAKN